MPSRLRRYVCTKCQEVRWIHNYHIGSTTCNNPLCDSREFRLQSTGGQVTVPTPLANLSLLAKPKGRQTWRCWRCFYSETVTGGAKPGVRIDGKEGSYCPACFAQVPKLERSEL